ncbi:hypothetical protein BDZ90DRAFT_229810 [Jaminaea rosea]|uniref:Uncharacterized protein n=1 Tax=Jaminaea rosea TaxID=1569628 RepID=A0A316V3N7_9BASI|nr:hypothetical protein BDZ90DRAFT_229810 [Jaminaea rosea]PWN30813.1 hypothetical protein BDZ90DRAFT_229810 [Jaminaea rosea]
MATRRLLPAVIAAASSASASSSSIVATGSRTAHIKPRRYTTIAYPAQFIPSSGESQATPEHTGQAENPPSTEDDAQIGPSHPSRPLEGFFHSSRALEVAPSDQEDHSYDSAAAPLFYDARYLPPQYVPHITGDIHPDLAATIETPDCEAAWRIYESQDYHDTESLRDLWWQISVPASRSYADVQTAVNRLVAISRRTSPDRLQWHRLMYLATAQLEMSRKMRPSHLVSPSLSTPCHVDAGSLNALANLLDSFRASGEAIDAPLLHRIFYQLCVHKRPREALDLWQAQLRAWEKGKFTLASLRGWASRPARLTTRTAEALLDALALAPHLRDMDAAQRLTPSETVALALSSMELILDDEVAVHKRPIREWMSHASLDTLWAMLPQRISKAAARRGEPWAVPMVHPLDSNGIDAARSSLRVSKDVQHVLVEAVAFQLARLGDLRAALTIYEVEVGKRVNSNRADIRDAIIVGATRNVNKLAVKFQKLVSSQQSTPEHQQILADAADGLDAGFFLFFDQPPAQAQLRSPTEATIFSLLAASSSMLLAAANGLRASEAQQQSLHWLAHIRRLTSTLLAEDPRLGQVSITLHTQLIRIHAQMSDLEYVKDLWVKFRQRTASPDLPHAVGTLPLKMQTFAWLFDAMIKTQKIDDTIFAVRLYFDWLSTRAPPSGKGDKRSKAGGGDLPPDILPRFVRTLAKLNMAHVVRRVLQDMRQQEVPLTPQLAIALLEAFGRPELAPFQQTVRTLDEFVQLQAPHRESEADGATVSVPHKGNTAHLSLNAYSLSLDQGSSRSVAASQWHERVKPNLSRIFALFIEELSVRLADHNRKSSRYDITEITIREAFNSALRTLLNWPISRLQKVDTRGALAAAKTLLSTWAPRGASTHSRGVQVLLSTMRDELIVEGDADTWSLELLACVKEDAVAEGGKETIEHVRAGPLDQALALWEKSLTATYEFQRKAPLQQRAILRSHSKDALIRALNSEGEGATDTIPYEGVLHASSSPSPDAASLPDAATTTSKPCRQPILPRPIRMRSRPTAYFMIRLALARRYEDAQRVYTTWMESLTREERFWSELAARLDQQDRTEGGAVANIGENETKRPTKLRVSVATRAKLSRMQEARRDTARARSGSEVALASPAFATDEQRKALTCRTVHVARLVTLMLESGLAGHYADEGGTPPWPGHEAKQRAAQWSEARRLFEEVWDLWGVQERSKGRNRPAGEVVEDVETEREADWRELVHHIAKIERKLR